MGTRPCARCGVRIPTDQYLCADCREERPVASPSPTAVGAVGSRSVRGAPTGSAPRSTWRGKPLPRGMVLPSRTQYHGTMFAFIAVAVAVTMTAAVLINKGVGPFTVSGIQTQQKAGVITVTGLVRNNGSHPGRARCVASWTDSQGGRQETSVVQSALIGASQAAPVTIGLADVAVVPNDVAIDCR